MTRPDRTAPTASRGASHHGGEGLAGLVERRRNRRTGDVVSLYRAAAAGLDPAGGPWVTLCEAHGSLCNHATRATARAFLSAPWEWCEGCAERVARER